MMTPCTASLYSSPKLLAPSHAKKNSRSGCLENSHASLFYGKNGTVQPSRSSHIRPQRIHVNPTALPNHRNLSPPPTLLGVACEVEEDQ
jgi:hypothetical protein